MPRRPRVPSGTEIYHVMMRGINHQNIFEEPEDYYQFINILDRMRTQYDDMGNPSGTNCTYYAYCLMSNHFHLLIREQEEKVGDTIKRIAGAYVYYYNHKYLRDGHLFKERFKSEPVRSALATNGTQERFGLFHDPSALYPPESCQGRYCYTDQGL